jgi:hypothetical protein
VYVVREASGFHGARVDIESRKIKEIHAYERLFF